MSITFKAKIQGDESIRLIHVPKFTKSHCDMAFFRSHKKYGGIANSDIFPNVLNRIRREKFGDVGLLDVNNPPEGVEIDDTGFLAIVTINIED